jgi:hypothetical protein
MRRRKVQEEQMKSLQSLEIGEVSGSALIRLYVVGEEN